MNDSLLSDGMTLATVDMLLRSLCGIYDEVAVDELDHALQAAGLAMDDGADDQLVLAAALHDIGRSPSFGQHADGQHERVAQKWLTPRFGERVGWLAGAHVAAKKYLVATEPGYAATLSTESQRTLQFQGGAAVDDEWCAHRWWPDAVRLRRYDDGAKVPGAPAPSVDDVVAVAERVLVSMRGAPQ